LYQPSESRTVYESSFLPYSELEQVQSSEIVLHFNTKGCDGVILIIERCSFFHSQCINDFYIALNKHLILRYYTYRPVGVQLQRESFGGNVTVDECDTVLVVVDADSQKA